MTLDTMISVLAQGFMTSMSIFALTLICSLPLGLFVCFGRMNRWAPFSFLVRPSNRLTFRGLMLLCRSGANGSGGIGVFFSRLPFLFVCGLAGLKPVQFITKVYISVMRGTPLMLQLMVVFYCPNLLFDIKVSGSWRFAATIVAFSLNYAAYFAEIYRSGIDSMPAGQYEAASVLGYTKGQTFFFIILPQVIKRVLPSLTNEAITLVKDTSLAYVIANVEIFTKAKQISSTYGTLAPYFISAVFYYVFNAIVAFIMERAEKALSYYK